MSRVPLLPNAIAIAEEIFHRKNMIAAKKAVEFHAQNGHKNNFPPALQKYVTKIGLALQECVVPTYRMRANTYLGSIDFICNKVLKNQALYKIMRVLEINSNGNTDKHDIKDTNIDIEFTLKHYNMLISDIVKYTGLSVFKTCYLNIAKRDRDIPIIEEEKHHKYFIVDGVKFQLKLNERYEVDPYSKTISSKITLYWPEDNNGKFVSVTVKTAKSNRILCSKEHIDVSSSNSKVALQFKCNEEDLDRRVLYLTVIVKVEKQVQEYAGTTGVLFWKEAHYKTVYRTTKTHTEQISQFFSKNHET